MVRWCAGAPVRQSPARKNLGGRQVSVNRNNRQGRKDNAPVQTTDSLTVRMERIFLAHESCGPYLRLCVPPVHQEMNRIVFMLVGRAHHIGHIDWSRIGENL